MRSPIRQFSAQYSPLAGMRNEGVLVGQQGYFNFISICRLKRLTIFSDPARPMKKLFRVVWPGFRRSAVRPILSVWYHVWTTVSLILRLSNAILILFAYTREGIHPDRSLPTNTPVRPTALVHLAAAVEA